MTKTNDTKSPKEGMAEAIVYEYDGKTYETYDQQVEAWRSKWIERECKEELFRDKNYFNPFANLRKINQYPDPDVGGAYHLRKMREEGWSKQHEDDLDYDGGYDAFLQYGNDDEWWDDIHELCYELNSYKKHWFIGRMIQFRKAFKEVSVILKGGHFRENSEDSLFHKIKEAFLTLFYGSDDVRKKTWEDYKYRFVKPSSLDLTDCCWSNECINDKDCPF